VAASGRGGYVLVFIVACGGGSLPITAVQLTLPSEIVRGFTACSKTDLKYIFGLCKENQFPTSNFYEPGGRISMKKKLIGAPTLITHSN